MFSVVHWPLVHVTDSSQTKHLDLFDLRPLILMWVRGIFQDPVICDASLIKLVP